MKLSGEKKIIRDHLDDQGIGKLALELKRTDS